MIRGSFLILMLAAAFALNGCSQCSQTPSETAAPETAPPTEAAPAEGMPAPEATPAEGAAAPAEGTAPTEAAPPAEGTGH